MHINLQQYLHNNLTLAMFVDMTQLLAFHNDPAIKAKYVARVKAHTLADEIRQGFYWQNGKGCAVGCTIEGNDHNRYETELGIPQQIARVEDGLFEALSETDAKAFPLQFLEAIPVGADLSMVVSNLMLDILAHPEKGLLQLPRLTDRTKVAIEQVAELYRRRLAGNEPTLEEWYSSRRDAADAADAADAYAYAYAADAAYAADDAADAAYAAAYAADDAAYAADDAAYAAAAAAAYAADAAAAVRMEARMEARLWQRDRLLDHLSNAPVLVNNDK
jgi:hypothetical protein